MVPTSRIRLVNTAPMHATRPVVLYWMIAARRARSNFGLEQAASHARRLRKPLVVLEALRVDHQWASDRFHQFVLDGMRDNRAAFDGQPGITYLPYVETGSGAGRGLLGALAAHAAVVVTDDFPCFFLPAMVEAAGRQLDVRLEAVDSNGLLPMRAVSTVFPTAHAFRRVLQKDAAGPPEGAPAVRSAGRAADRTGVAASRGHRRPMAGRVHLARRRRRDRAAADRPRRPPDRSRGRRRRGARAADVVRRSRARPPTATNATCPIATPPAGSSPYLHWGTSRPARGVRAADDTAKAGWAICRRRPPGLVKAGGACRRRPRGSSTSSSRGASSATT